MSVAYSPLGRAPETRGKPTNGRRGAQPRVKAAPAAASYVIVKLAAGGDVLLTTALARALRAARPDARIGWITSAYAAPMLEGNPDVDALMVVAGAWDWLRALRGWRRRHGPANVLLAHRSGWLYWSARACRAGRVVAFGREAPYRLDLHRLQRQAQLLAAAGVAVEAGELRPRLQLTARERAAGVAAWAGAGADTRPRWVMAAGGGSNPWSAMPNRVWARERFLDLARRAQAAGVALRWVGGAGDEERTAWICARLADGAGMNLAGKLSLRQTAAVVAAADLVIGNDSLPLVMAQALERPGLGIYGPTRGALIHAPGQPYVQGQAGCGPCYDPRDGRQGQAFACAQARCMEQAAVAAVWEQACRFTRQRPSRLRASEIAGRGAGLPTRSRPVAGGKLSRRLLAPRPGAGDEGEADQREARGPAPSKGGASRLRPREVARAG